MSLLVVNAARLETTARELRARGAAIEASVAAIRWHSPGARAFAGRLGPTLSRLRTCSSDLDTLAAVLRRRAHQCQP